MTSAAPPGLAPPPGMTLAAALAESHRCLMCWDAPCIRACPTAIDIPGFIKRIAQRNDIGAARVILEANLLGDSCAHACPTAVLCEGACVMNDVDARPVAIGRLQAFATGPVVQGGVQLFSPGAATGKRVAVVGAGPAGLACAGELAKRGHEAVVFDASAESGGLNTKGVAEYKQSRHAALAEIDWLRGLGFTIHHNSAVGGDDGFAELIEEFDAVFIGTGLGDIPPLGIAGEDLPGVWDALELIAAAKTEVVLPGEFAGKRVAVLGGGNTALDAVRLAVRLGAAATTLVYRRGPDEMPGYAHEAAAARREGVQFSFWSTPHSVVGGATVTALRCLRTKPGPPGDDGRPSVVPAEEAPFDIPVEVVVRATGQVPDATRFAGLPALEMTARGRIIVDDEQRTSQPGVWAGGDCVNGGKEVVNAVAEGMAAARSIDAELRR